MEILLRSILHDFKFFSNDFKFDVDSNIVFHHFHRFILKKNDVSKFHISIPNRLSIELASLNASIWIYNVNLGFKNEFKYGKH